MPPDRSTLTLAPMDAAVYRIMAAVITIREAEISILILGGS